MTGRHRGMWRGALLATALAAAGTQAGEFTIGSRIGGTDLDVGSRYTSSGESLRDSGLLAIGWSAAYRWTAGPMIEAVALQSVDPFPLFGWEDLEHYSLGAGWQFDMGKWWHFTPKLGLVYTELSSEQEDFFEGNEPVDKFSDVVPFAEATLEGRIHGHFGIGLYMRENFEKFGSSTSVGVTFGWTFF